MIGNNIRLTTTAQERLSYLLRAWKEEVRIDGPSGTGQSLLTEEDVKALEKRIERLHLKVVDLNDEYTEIMEYAR